MAPREREQPRPLRRLPEEDEQADPGGRPDAQLTRERAFPLGAAVTLEALERDPHPIVAELREREPVTWLAARGGWLVTRRDLALAAMRDDAGLTVDDPRFSTAQVVGPSMLSLDGAEHSRHRDPFAPAFRREAVLTGLSAAVDAEAGRLVEQLAARGRAELRTELAGPLAAAVMAHALGLASLEPATLLGWYRAIVSAVEEVTAGSPVPASAVEAVAALGERVEPMLAGVGGLTREDAVSNVAVLMFGGIDTTAGAIANAAMHLLGHPDQLAAAAADRALLANAVEESLRLEPAAALIDRYATRNLELGGASIAAGDLVSISIAGANRDPATFPEPDRFDIRRRNARRHLAFAAGPHVCVGMHMARLEVESALAHLLGRLRGLRLDPDRASPAARGLVFRKPPELHVVWGSRAAGR